MNTTYAEDILERVRAKQRAQAEKAAREEAERHKARIIIKPKNEDFGKFKPQTVRELIEIITGRHTEIDTQKVDLPERLQAMSLVLSSKGDSYYRVTPDSCTCKGWHYSQQKHGIGKCRHHTLAFPEEAAQNAESLEMIVGPRKLARPPEEKKQGPVIGIENVARAMKDMSIKESMNLPPFKPFDTLPSERRIRTVA